MGMMTRRLVAWATTACSAAGMVAPDSPGWPKKKVEEGDHDGPSPYTYQSGDGAGQQPDREGGQQAGDSHQVSLSLGSGR
jgi:hypothetical protein